MNELTQRRIRRLGIVTIAAVLTMLALVVLMPPDTITWLPLLVTGLIAATGIGLVVRARFARALAILGAVALLATHGWGFYEVLRLTLKFFEGTVIDVLGIANAVATMVLGGWLTVRAIQLLAGRAPTAIPITARIVGVTFAIAAINHLWFAHLAGGSQVGFSFNVSPQGIMIGGFPGWPVWHGAMLLTGLVMGCAPRRLLRLAATAFAALIFALVPLSIVAVVRVDLAPIQLSVFAVAMMSLGAYLAWWLREDTKAFA